MLVERVHASVVAVAVPVNQFFFRGCRCEPGPGGGGGGGVKLFNGISVDKRNG